jgi:hypothetical protein
MNTQLKKTAISVAILSALGVGTTGVVVMAASALYAPFDNDPTKSGEITFPELAMEVYDPITDNFTGEHAVFQGTGGSGLVLDVLPGFDDARIPTQTFTYNRIVTNIPSPACPNSTSGSSIPVYSGPRYPTSGSSLPVYSAANETLCIPSVELQKVTILPDGTRLTLPSDCYEVTFDLSTTQPDVFSFKSIFKLDNCP